MSADLKTKTRGVEHVPQAAHDAPVDQGIEGLLIPVRSRLRRVIEFTAPPIVALIVLLTVWALAIRLTNTSPFVAPSPGDVVVGFRDNESDIVTALWATVKDAFIGLGLSVLLGIALAVLMSQSKWIERAIYPYTTLAQTVPIFAIAPIIDAIAGGGHASIVAVSLIIAIFPVIANTYLGLTSVDVNQINLFVMYNASRTQQFALLRFPFAVPYMLTGIRVASGLSIIGAIVGEVLLGNGGPVDGGLGYEIQYAGHQGDWGLLGAAALASGILGIVIFVVLGALSTIALRHWHESATEQES
jgi:NitT/TauT family transport system permease protein